MSSTYVPWLYDAAHDGAIGDDCEFYLALARSVAGSSRGPVLELGAGTGRTLLPIARAGIDCVGVELDEGMREQLTTRVSRLPDEVRHRVEVVAGDMRDLALERTFAMVQIPFRAFLHNLDRDAQLACLSVCLRHLRPGGTLALNCFHPSLAYMARRESGGWAWVGDTQLADGRVVVRSEAASYDTARQRVSSRLRYELVEDDGRVSDTWIQRLELAFLYPGDFRELLAEAGFEAVEIFGGADRRPFTRDGEELYVVARKPGGDDEAAAAGSDSHG